jgi:DNA processing protein
MATGIEQTYPRRHRDLAVDVAVGGCLLSEFPPGSPPLRANFPQRNRLISGLSLATVVIEAALPSGSLLTAGSALEQGREVFAAPWSIFHRNGRGCLRLIRDGAGIVESIEDVLLELGALHQLQLNLENTAIQPSGEAALPAGQARLLALLGDTAEDLDSLVAASQLPVAVVLAGLSALELLGRIARSSGGYVRC